MEGPGGRKVKKAVSKEGAAEWVRQHHRQRGREAEKGRKTGFRKETQRKQGITWDAFQNNMDSLKSGVWRGFYCLLQM